MKILRLYFENLNALRGKHRIDFTQPPFCDNGLFAITGATGAGKTTLLDAICLALYHQTPRLGALGPNQNEVMSRGTAECHAEVELQINGQIWRASWSQKRARGDIRGKLQPARVELARVADNKIVADKVKEKLALIEQLSGLNFERFTRSVMLSQGDFAAFLKAKSDERAELLEQLTGTEIYGQISQRVFEQHKEVHQQLERRRARLDGVALLLPEQRQEIEASLQQLQVSEQALSEQLRQYQQAEQWQQRCRELTHYRENQHQSLEQQRQQHLAAEPMREQLSRSEPAEQIRPLWQQSQQNEQELALTQQQQQATLKQQQSLEQRVATAQQQRDQAQQSYRQQQREQQHFEQRLIEEIAPLDQQIAHLNQQLAQSERDLHSADAALANMIPQQQQQQDAWSKAQQVKQQCQQWNRQHSSVAHWGAELSLWQQQFDDITQRQQRLAQLKPQVQQLEEALKALTPKRQESESQLNHHQLQQQQLRQQLEQLRQTEQQQQQVSPRQALQQQLRQLQQFRQPLQQLSDIALRWQALQQQRQQLEEQQRFETRQSQELTLQLEQLMPQSERLQKQVNDLEQICRLEREIVSLSQLRDQLTADAPCPLCGSCQHPAIEQYQALSPQHHQQQLEAAQQQATEIREQIVRLQTQAQSLQQQSLQTEERQTALAAEAARQQESWQALCQQWQLALTLTDESGLQRYTQEHEGQLAQLEQQLTAQDQLQQQLTAVRDKLETLQAQGQQLQTDHQRLLHQQQQLEQQVQQLQQQVEELNTQQHQQQQKLTQGITAFELKLPTWQEMQPWLLAQQQLWRQWQQNQHQLQQVNQQELTLKHELALTEQQLTQWREQHQRASHTVQQSRAELSQLQQTRHQAVGELSIGQLRQQMADLSLQKAKQEQQAQQDWQTQHDQWLSLQGRLSQLNEKIEQLKQQQQILSADLLQQIKDCDFSDQAAFLAALLTPEQRQRLQHQIQQIDNDYARYQTLAEQAAQQLAQHQQQRPALAETTGATLQATLQQLTADLRDNSRQQGEYQHQLNQDNTQRLQQQQLIQEIDQQAAVALQWDHLNRLIGSASGVNFRRFAQGLTLEHLIWLANRQLERLHGRYRLQRANEQQLELLVVDSWQADELRDTRTLSGGESFLVSLALALALSDLMSDKNRIESLFLDEGFGTLDADTLDTALDALDSLNAAGRMIGVISHVEAMKERIPVQIRLKKRNGLGYSSLELPNI